VDSTHWASSPAPIINYKSDTNSHYGASFGTNNPGYASLALSTNGGSWAVVATSTDRMYGDAWNHIAFVRSGANIYIYTNGVRYTASTTYSGNVYIVPNVPVIIGRGGTAGSYQFQFKGSMSGLRVVKGTALYTDASFTPPTTPPTAVSGTNILCNYANAGILDNTNSNILQTVGNAQVDTSVVKFGTGSMKFDGNDQIAIPVSTSGTSANPSNVLWDFGSGAFTIEFWVRVTTLSINQTFMFHGWSGSGALNYGWNISLNTSNQLYMYANGVKFFNDLIFSTNTWHHLALCGDGSGNLTAYLDGTKSSTTNAYTSIVARPTANLVIGGWTNNNEYLAERYFMTGWLDDIRITKGVARYTTDFDPPTLAFRNIGA